MLLLGIKDPRVAETTEGATEGEFDMGKISIRTLPPTITDSCGSIAGYIAHRRRQEEFCDPCFLSNQEYNTNYRKNNRAQILERKKVYREANKERIRKSEVQWKIDNPERSKLSRKKSSAKNREKISRYHAIWANQNKELVRIKGIAWREKNKEEIRRKKKEYRLENAEILKKKKADYYEKNRKEISIKRAEEYANLPKRIKSNRLRKYQEKRSILARQRRARILSAPSEPYTTQQILDLYGTNCHICRKPIDLEAPRHSSQGGNWKVGLQLDHVIPIALGGTDLIENIRPSHAICNLTKPRKKNGNQCE